MNSFEEFFSTSGLNLEKRLSPLSSTNHTSFLVNKKANHKLVAKCPLHSDRASAFSLNCITSSKAGGKYLQAIEELIEVDGNYIALYKYLPYSLSNLIDKQVSLSLTLLTHLASEVLQSLNFLYQDSISLAHNNLKPANIFFDKRSITNSSVYLSDLKTGELSIASASNDLKKLGLILIKLMQHNSTVTRADEVANFLNNKSNVTIDTSWKKLLTEITDLKFHQGFSHPKEIVQYFLKNLSVYIEPKVQIHPVKEQYLTLLEDRQSNTQLLPEFYYLQERTINKGPEMIGFLKQRYFSTQSDEAALAIIEYILGEKIEDHYDYCESLLKELVANKNATAHNLLGICYVTGSLKGKDEQKAYRLFLRGLSLPSEPDTNNDLRHNLALCYKQGIGVAKAPYKATDL